MSKYEDLEGIDQESREVYETSDTEETWDVQESTTTRRDSISEEIFDTESSRQRFEKEKVIVDAHVTDFSDRVDRVAGYETATMTETTQNKLNRLRLELRQLEDELATEGSEEEEKELKSLLDALVQIDLKTKQKKLIPTQSIIRNDDEITEVQEDTTTGHDVVTSPEEVIILDERLSKLERLLGSDFEPDTSLQSTINELFRKLKLLSNDKEQLAHISHAIDDVNTKFERSIAMRRATDLEADISEESQVHEIYTVFQRTKAVHLDLPFIIKRMETLGELHTKTAAAVCSVEQLDAQIEMLNKDIRNWETSLNKLESKLDEMNGVFEKNQEAIWEKLAKK